MTVFSIFQFMAQQLDQTDTPFLLVGSFRTEETAENPALTTLLADLARLPHFARLTLPPFAEAETEKLIAVLGQPMSDDLQLSAVRDALLQATGGNPLYMTEILQEVTIGEGLPTALPMPPSLAALIGRRLAQLPANGRQVIESLAILEQPAFFDLAQEISARSEEETVTAVDTALRWRLLRLHDQYQVDFSHDLMRTAVWRQISPMRRQRLHRRAALALAQFQAEAATIAYHWGQAGDREKESEYAFAAAHKAARLYAFDEAIRFFQRAIPHLTNNSDCLEALRRLGQVYQLISDWEHAQAVLSEGLAASEPETADEAHFQILLGQLYSRQSHYRRALKILEQAYRTCQRLENDALLSECVGTMGIIHYFQDDYEKSLACYQEALGIVQELQMEAEIALWLSNIATIHLYRRDYELALTNFQQAVRVQKRLGNLDRMAVSLGNMGDIYRETGQYQEAVAYHSEAAQIRHEWGDKAGAATNLRDLGIDYAEAGLKEAALACFWQSLTLDIELARRDACGVVLGNIGRVLAEDDRQGAQAALETAVSLLRLTRSRLFLCQFLLQFIDLLWPQGEWERIEELLQEATALAHEMEQADLLFAVRVTGVRLRVSQNQMSLAEAIHRLEELPKDDAQKAAADYAIWRLDTKQEERRRETAERYKRLYEQTPLNDYRQRYAVLTTVTLPSPALPDPFALVTPLATELSPFLSRVRAFLNT